VANTDSPRSTYACENIIITVLSLFWYSRAPAKTWDLAATVARCCAQICQVSHSWHETYTSHALMPAACNLMHLGSLIIFHWITINNLTPKVIICKYLPSYGAVQIASICNSINSQTYWRWLCSLWPDITSHVWHRPMVILTLWDLINLTALCTWLQSLHVLKDEALLLGTRSWP